MTGGSLAKAPGSFAGLPDARAGAAVGSVAAVVAILILPLVHPHDRGATSAGGWGTSAGQRRQKCLVSTRSGAVCRPNAADGPGSPSPGLLRWGDSPLFGGFRERQQPGDKGLGSRFGPGTRRLALCTGCLTRDEGQCLHRHSLSLIARGSRADGLQREAQAPALPGFRLIRETSASRRTDSHCEKGATHPTAGVGGLSGRPHAEVRRERVRRSDGGTKDPHPAEVL